MWCGAASYSLLGEIDVRMKLVRMMCDAFSYGWKGESDVRTWGRGHDTLVRDLFKFVRLLKFAVRNSEVMAASYKVSVFVR